MFSDIKYGEIAIQRMEEKVLVFDGENFKSDGVQIVEHLKKENDSEYRYISLTDVANGVIRKAKELNPNGEFIFERNGERLTASRLSTKGMPLDKIRDMLGQVDEKTTLSYIYNPNTEQENLIS